jgi:hypothetical protein
MTATLDRTQLESMERNNLVALAKELGVKASGKSAEIIDRIVAVKVDVQDDNELTDEDRAAITEAEKEETAAQTENVDKAAVKGVAVRVIHTYLDKRLEIIKHEGNIFTVDKERADELIAAKVAEIMR